MHRISTKAVIILVAAGLVIIGATFLSFYKTHQKNVCGGSAQKPSAACISRQICPGLTDSKSVDCHLPGEAK